MAKQIQVEDVVKELGDLPWNDGGRKLAALRAIDVALCTVTHQERITHATDDELLEAWRALVAAAEAIDSLRVRARAKQMRVVRGKD